MNPNPNPNNDPMASSISGEKDPRHDVCLLAFDPPTAKNETTVPLLPAPVHEPEPEWPSLNKTVDARSPAEAMPS
jgi:hypothetical protein